jgi:hypothetical protein
MEGTSHFETVLESIETLPTDDQEILLELVRKRLAERRRAEIAANIAESRAEYRAGNVHRGTVDDLMAEIAD